MYAEREKVYQIREKEKSDMRLIASVYDGGVIVVVYFIDLKRTFSNQQSLQFHDLSLLSHHNPQK